MSFGQRIALNVTPLVLRLALAVVFIWAGSSKLLKSSEYGGQAAATLANIGLIDPPLAGGGPSPAANADAALDEETSGAGGSEPAAADPESAGENGAAAPQSGQTGSLTGELKVEPKPADADRATPDQAGSGGKYSADDFPGPVTAPRRYGLVLLMHHASQPGPNGAVLWPSGLTGKNYYAFFALFVPIVEFVGGLLILVGFVTRFWALNMAGTMVVAMWLTQIGPVVAGATPGFLGFLPDPMLSEPNWVEIWQPLMLQMMTLAAAVGVLLAGPGRLSLDALIFRRSKHQASRVSVTKDTSAD